jgi:ribonuclease Z
LFAVTILGNNSAIPAHNRHPTAQVLQTSDNMMLIDCGEGTQMQMSTYKIKRNKINHIFISHLHGDHYFGLIGLLNSLGLNNRTNDLHIYAPYKLQSIIRLQVEVSGVDFSFRLCFYNLEKEEIIFEDKKLSVACFKVNHRIECWGFLFREKKNLRKIDIEKAHEYNVPTTFFENLHRGEDYLNATNELIRNETLTVAGDPPKSYAYCADTAFYEPIAEKIKGVDLVYHESTYLDEHSKKAQERFHSTSKQAALIAKKAGVKKLLLGHFSSQYETLDEFKNEACAVFENTEISEEGACYIV